MSWAPFFLRPRHGLRAGALWLLVLAPACAPARAPGPPGPQATPAPPAGASEAETELAAEPASPEPEAAADVPELPDDKAADGGDHRPRIGSIKWYTYIWEEPLRRKDRLAIGRLRVGSAVALKSMDPVKGSGCNHKWYRVEPHGFVCADDTTTFNFASPFWKALHSLEPGPGAYPYKYAFSTGAPMYSRLPTPEEQKKAEEGFGPLFKFKSLGDWSRGHEMLVDQDPDHRIKADSEVPEFYRDHKGIPGSPWHPSKPKARVIPAGSGFSYASAFEADGRTWLLTPELFLIPADRVFPYKPSSFHGVALDGDLGLPLAWVRGERAAKLRRGEAGSFSETGEAWASKDHIPLTGKTEQVGKVTFHETGDDGLWVAARREISVVVQAEKLHEKLRPDEKWIEARIMAGTMTAYVGARPVWTTLWSGGTGGVPIPGKDPKKYATTEIGLFPFQWKDKVATMSPDKGAPTVFWFGDVPNIQYVHAPLAMHVAYWHDSFGFLMSAECLNVSAEDGAWLFDFTEPRLPPGWNAIGPSPSNGKSTRIHIKPY